MKRAKKLLHQIKASLNGDISRKQGVYTLELDPLEGKGFVKCISFNSCMNAVVFDVTLKEDREFLLTKEGADMVYFLYCLNGDCRLNLDTVNEGLKIEELQSAVIYSKPDSQNSFRVGEGTRFVFTFIGINRERYHTIFKGDFRGLDGRLNVLMDRVYDSEDHYYLGHYNLKVGEYVKALDNHNYNHEISSFLYFEGYCSLILANQIEQFYRSLNDNINTTGLTQDELQRVQEVSDYIKNYPEIQHSINSLGSKSGLSPNKLQEGFKFMHGRTVSDFVRNVRLEKAEDLIKNTDLNISEVVYTIGLTSRSYFCKIFKNKYDCSPNEYRSRAGQTVFSPE
jgi:AraC-like DNA-binding protein